DFLLLGDGVVDLLCLLAGASNAPPRTSRIVERAAVVVAHLNEYEVARFGRSEDLVPAPLGLERPATAPADRVVLDFYLRLVEQGNHRIAPALLALRAGPHGRIADDEESGEFRRRLVGGEHNGCAEESGGDCKGGAHDDASFY